MKYRRIIKYDYKPRLQWKRAGESRSKTNSPTHKKQLTSHGKRRSLAISRWFTLPILFTTLLLAGMASHELRKVDVGLPEWTKEKPEDRLIPPSLSQTALPPKINVESPLDEADDFELDGPELVGDVEHREFKSEFSPESLVPAAKTGWDRVTVQKGDNISLIFSRLELSKGNLDKILSLGKETNPLKHLQPDENIQFFIRDGELSELLYQADSTHTLHVYKAGDQFTAKTETVPRETRTSMTTVSISDSLFLAGQAAGLSDHIIMQLIEVFRWDIDFTEIQEGDSFAVIYQEMFQNGEKVGDGNILAAEFTHQGKSYRAVRYEEGQQGQAEYFSDRSGHSLRKSFLRTPVKFTRITSHFSNKRKHPILHKIRAHKGTDYAAPIGTPVTAAGDGKIKFVGSQSGYGRTIIIDHGQTYSTLYAHLSRYAQSLKQGQTIHQGEVIGYVGMSGLSTGPHLHYEFRVNGVHQNPLSVKMAEAPTPTPMHEKRMAEFTKKSSPLFAQLDMLTQTHARVIGSETTLVKSRVIR
jgi:murein DD-endopeptidase MepM/ murein hydrolase activator NlpD